MSLLTCIREVLEEKSSELALLTQTVKEKDEVEAEKAQIQAVRGSSFECRRWTLRLAQLIGLRQLSGIVTIVDEHRTMVFSP